MEGRAFRVRGRVQGVGFRWWARGKAREFGLVGWIRNCPDGSVEVHAHGSPSSLDALRSALQIGPPGAIVTGIDEEPLDAEAPADFEIRR